MCYNRKLAQTLSVDDQGKDKDVSFAHNNDFDEVCGMCKCHIFKVDYIY